MWLTDIHMDKDGVWTCGAQVVTAEDRFVADPLSLCGVGFHAYDLRQRRIVQYRTETGGGRHAVVQLYEVILKRQACPIIRLNSKEYRHVQRELILRIPWFEIVGWKSGGGVPDPQPQKPRKILRDEEMRVS